MAESMRGMRNRIVHDYDNVDMKILWETATPTHEADFAGPLGEASICQSFEGSFIW